MDYKKELANIESKARLYMLTKEATLRKVEQNKNEQQNGPIKG